MSSDSLGSKFVSNCRAILDVFSDTCSRVPNPPIDTTTFSIVDVALKVVDGESMLKYYAKETSKYWDKVAQKDETYVCNNVDVILNSVQMDSGTRELINSLINSEKMSQVVHLINKNDRGVPEEDKDMTYIWEAMSALVRLSIKYVDECRSKNPNALPEIKFNVQDMKNKYLH